MSRGAANVQTANFAQHAGTALLSASQAILKGVLEADFEVALLVGVQGGFELGASRVFEPAIQDVLRQHNMRLMSVATASRAVSLAVHAARLGKGALALIPNEQLDSIVGLLAQISMETLERGALVVLLEDRPRDCPASCPRSAVHRLHLPCIEPIDVSQLRDSMEQALRLSRASRHAAAVVIHHTILQSADTLEMSPNRVHSSVDAMLARRKRPRGLRWTDATGPLRAARRLELNKMRAMPSPGERVPVGFVTVGPCDTALKSVTNALGLHGRVPVLQLGLINPVDESAVSRLLTRCQRVLVLEPRPGVLEPHVLAIAEHMRHQGEQPATVWGQEVPALESEAQRTERPWHFNPSIDRLFSLHPSLLVRRIVHLLHMVRPTAQIETRLAPDPPFTINPTIPARGTAIGQRGAITAVKRILADVDQWLREQIPSEESGPAVISGFAIDGAPAAAENLRIVTVETWDHQRYVHEGLPALGLAGAENRPWMFVVCESESEPLGDLERLTRGAIPAAVADRLRLYTGNLNDQTALRDTIREAALDDRMSVIIVRDGPPARFDVAAIEHALEEVDRLGFEPRQRLIRAAEAVCAITPRPVAVLGIDFMEEEVEASEWSIADDQASWSAAQIPELKPHLKVEELTRSGDGGGAGFRFRVRPLLEEVEVIRTRPPLMSWRSDAMPRLPAPQPIHARSTAWRAHLAGIRREPPGVAAQVLCEAGRLMGYHVRYVQEPTPIVSGLGAWAQVLYTHNSQSPISTTISAMIPHGEADVLIGLDEHETWRAIGGDPMLRVAHHERTHAVVNLKPAMLREASAEGAVESESRQSPMSSLVLALSNVTVAQPRLMDDFADACKAWFHTDRVADLAMLGTAFQLGLIPVSVEAIEAAVNLVQARGYGRSREAFEFGRRIAVNRELLGRPRQESDENVERLSRRIVLSLSRGGWGGGGRARNMHELLHQSLDAMPGLAETEAGRTARRTFVQACHRCRVWGGFEYARQYAELIMRLYQHDRADTGRALTRFAVLPLAETMLIRDPLYLAGMATSSEQRRRLRQWLNVKLARGDHIERRYLTRIELVAFNRLVRADLKTSDWPARVVSLFRRVVPVRWRGSRRQRELRDFVLEFIRRAADSTSGTDQGWLEPMHRLHLMAAEDRLRDMAIAEVKMLVEAGVNMPTEPLRTHSVTGAV